MTQNRAASGGEQIADVLLAQGVRHVFTLCGGHISPILVAAKARGIHVVDVRDEATAAFAADAAARLTGVPGVAAVTAGPGVTNTITAVKNAQLAQSPLVVLGGATGTILKGRGSLQDIDQEALVAPHVKWSRAVDRVRDLAPAVSRAFTEAKRGVPGPVFVECPVDLLYEESVVREIYGVGDAAAAPRNMGERALRWYLGRHLDRLFAPARRPWGGPVSESVDTAEPRGVDAVAQAIQSASRPVALIGSQALAHPGRADTIAAAVASLEIPVYLSGMARGLLGPSAPNQLRHKRTKALRDADFVLLAGVPCDFRLDYGRHIPRPATLASVNLSSEDLRKNRRPEIGLLADPGPFLEQLAAALPDSAVRRHTWFDRLRKRDAAREAEIDELATRETDFVNPLHFFRTLDPLLDDDSILVADGGDFVATASYTLRPRGPLRWLDPGVFGTLGVGGGFAVGAKACRPASEVWLIYGDGSSAYSLAEFDTYRRHGLPVIAVIGNDASWAQIAREQVEILGDDCATALRRTDYEVVAEGYGGAGLRIETPDEIEPVLREAKRLARAGTPVCVNVLIGSTDFRKGSISM